MAEGGGEEREEEGERERERGSDVMRHSTSSPSPPPPPSDEDRDDFEESTRLKDDSRHWRRVLEERGCDEETIRELSTAGMHACVMQIDSIRNNNIRLL